MPELSAPLRLTWELPADPALALRLWRKIADARVLFLEMDLSPDAVSALHSIAGELENPGGPRLTVLATGETARRVTEVVPFDAMSNVQLFLLPPYPEGEEEKLLSQRFQSVIWCLWSTPKGLDAFAAAVGRARRSSGEAAILNPKQPASPLGEADRAEAARVWRQEGDDGVRLRVHDLFLDEALGRDPFSSYAGCQAGRTLAHLRKDGLVVGCRTLPAPLGDLSRSAFTEIWSGSERQRFLERLEKAPRECKGCAAVDTCAGGCRGLGGREKKDPSCTRVTVSRGTP